MTFGAHWRAASSARVIASFIKRKHFVSERVKARNAFSVVDYVIEDIAIATNTQLNSRVRSENVRTLSVSDEPLVPFMETLRRVIVCGLVLVFAVTIVVRHRLAPAELVTKRADATSVTVLLYNRIPKCGSTLMNSLLQTLSKTNGRFKQIFPREFREHHGLSLKGQQQMISDLLNNTRILGSHPIVYMRHFYYFPVPSTPNVTFLYINQYRDPLARTLSNYDHRQYTCIKPSFVGRCRSLPASLTGKTMEECVSTGDPARCLETGHLVRSPIPYLCGHSSICDDRISRPTSDAAVALAKTNIEKYFIHVGLLEYLESSLQLMEHIQPSIFTALLDTYKDILKQRYVNRVPTRHRHGISNKTRDILLELLKPEYDLYHFIHARFIDRYTKAFHRAPMSSELQRSSAS